MDNQPFYRAPGSKSLRELLIEKDQEIRQRPYQLTGYRHAGKQIVDGFSLPFSWLDVQHFYSRCVFRSPLQGIRNSTTHQEYPVGTPDIPPGTYEIVSATILLPSHDDLLDLIDAAVQELKKHRISHSHQMAQVEAELLLQFSHSTCHQEGNTLSLDETKALARLLAEKGTLDLEDLESFSAQTQTQSSVKNVREALNHLKLASALPSFATNQSITEGNVLKFHAVLMEGLLTKPDEGLPGEYRKIPLQIEGYNVHLAHPEDVPSKINAFFLQLQQGIPPLEEYTLEEYLTKIHAEFQGIHPFRDGNGRIGRLIMNILCLKQGYPLMVFAPEHSLMFCEAMNNCHQRGSRFLFARMVLECWYYALVKYEETLGVPLFPQKDIKCN